jgi:lipoprotein NlpD
MSYKWIVLISFILLTACGEREGLAPVTELNWREVNSHATRHVVRRGETLYAIAFRYDQDYRQLAVANNLKSPYTVHVGQVIQLKPNGGYASPLPPAPRALYPTAAKPKFSYTKWLWPVRGRVAANYAPINGQKGINIAGKKHEKVRAARAGVVAYAGSGLAGYGNLIIIKHDNQYLTAYGNNLRNFVKEGQHISAGQPIAEMGVIDRRYWGVHFEIRKLGQPVNPLNYLQNG